MGMPLEELLRTLRLRVSTPTTIRVLIREGWKVLLPLLAVLIIAACESGGVASTAANGESVVEGKIKLVGSDYGNLDTDITESLVKAAGLRQGEKFLFSCQGKSFTATFAAEYTDVPRGDWIGLVNWESNLRLARSFANAAESSGCGLNDVVTISPIK